VISAADIERAGAVILAGGLVAAPTETVYGLAGDATNDLAVARIYEAKGRPSFNPLIAHVGDFETAYREIVFSPLAERLARAFWPGPLTLVLPRASSSTVSLLASAGLPTLAVRMPDHAATLALIKAVGRPLAAPSANLSGAISPTTAAHVRESLGDRVDLILDGGACGVGVESTIVKVDADRAAILRPGGLARDEIERVVGAKVPVGGAGVEAPGMLASHYAPRAALRLDAKAPAPGEAYLAFGASAPSGTPMLNLSAHGDLREAAANLFAHLHALDRLCAVHGLSRIAVAPIPETGLGEAINDRLRRAAAPRPSTPRASDQLR
jgi:L-threonylcarbamoyladenylate synthase